MAQALAARTSPERVAEYLLAAGPAAAPMVPWLAGHADELAARTPALAAELFSRVLETTPDVCTRDGGAARGRMTH